MSRTDDFDRGVKNRRAVLGDAWVDKSLSGANSINADYQDLITRFAWNDIWSRPGLNHGTRRLLVLGMTMGLARWEEFELHCRAAVRASQQSDSVTLEQIKETLLQGAIYCGVPAANTGFKIFMEVLKAEGIASTPAPLTDDHRVSTHYTFSRPQLKIALQGAPQGLPIVLSHALGFDLHLWDQLSQELGHRHPVLRYDHRAHGGSESPAGPYTMSDLVEDAARVVREWDVGPVLWIGLSMGGMVGQGLAIRHPELVRALVLANTCAKYPPEAVDLWRQRIAAVESGGTAAVADVVLGRCLTSEFRAARPDIADKCKATLLATDAKGYAAACNAVATVDWIEQLNRVAVPALIIAGAHDIGITAAMSEALKERLPNATLAVLENASHLSVLEQPKEFSALVRDFIGRLPESSA